MRTKARQVLPALLIMVLTFSGCVVATARYEEKVREADALRDALAAANKGKAAAETRIEALQKQAADQSARNAELAARLQAREEESRNANEELALARKNYEGTRITREQLISELMEKEKATGKRIQELVGRAQECELALEKNRNETALRDAEIADLRRKAAATPDAEALRRERDTLLGRIERIVEERRIEEKKRDDRFLALARSLEGRTPPVPVAILGPAVRMALSDKEVGSAKDPRLSAPVREAVAEVGKAAADLHEAVLIVTAGSAPIVEEIRGALLSAKVPDERIRAFVRERERGAELLLVVP